MGQKIIRSWEELWKVGRLASGTHWNYSRGKLRFRTATKQPYAIGHEIRLDPGPPVRVRFYTFTDGEFVESPYRMAMFRPSAEIITVPMDFERWDPKRQRNYIAGMIETLSAPRFAERISPADRILLRIVAALQIQIAAQAQRIAELQQSLSAQKGPKPLDSQKGRTSSSPGLTRDTETSNAIPLLLQALMSRMKPGP